ncbi:Carbohydrate family 9 binding domain-like [Cyclobacterium lianum]|uniref:Carbohydrate family 9 binding domain-like n=1 Tax=Cyclobacterium lianum TaxID=388280 RepID=A0A1M7I0L0_9BACT|nr:carbohydrate-binding family 9-like protein [Cyclobacterium lianum]SHM34179.1 Carbohydrate family 9 binding domain-like [Cyclobacterium lianum]
MHRNISLGLLVVLINLPLLAQDIPGPRSYLAYQLQEKLTIDGLLEESAWKKAPWSEPFQDIRGGDFPAPAQLTRMKLLWDQNHLYIAIRLEENHLWATYTERESVIFQENDIEIFIDPDGDTHHYYEVEINALGTLWDLLMTRPYKNGGKPINGWNINEFQYAVHLEGTLNEPSDTDEYWILETAIPWKSLSQSGPNFRAPEPGEHWKINFSRVQWRIEATENGYAKKINPDTGKAYPEDNWVWSAMGQVNMHIPERWGYVQFSDIIVGEGTASFQIHPDEKIKNELRKYYEAQRKLFANSGHYSKHPDELDIVSSLTEVKFEVGETRFKISAPSAIPGERRWNITEDSRIWQD